jgi:hypothetical protein
MDRNAFTPELRGKLFTALTGRTGAVGGSLVDQLSAAFGPGARGARVNARAAAQALGVSTRTVQRWVAGDSKPKPANAQAVRRRARQAATTKAGRRSAMATARGDRASRYGARLHITGTQGPLDYERYRRTANLDLDPAMVEQLRDAYEAGGDRGVVDWATGALDQNYVSDWNIVSIDDIRFDSM